MGLRRQDARDSSSRLAGSGASLAIARRPRRALRIGTLSWKLEHEQRDLNLDTFEAALKQAVRRRPQPDLILVAGRTLQTAPARCVLPRTAIVLEAKNRDCRSWYLATSAGCSRLREDQIVYKHDELREMSQLSRLVARGRGLIQHPGVSLLLLICGENNALNTRGGSSVLREARGGLHGHLGKQPWIVLNPAHKPYKSRSRSSGYAKIGPVAGCAPTLKRLVHQQWEYRDGTRAPLAVIHCNNFNTRGWTRQVASRCFARQLLTLHCVDQSEWRYVLYEIPL